MNNAHSNNDATLASAQGAQYQIRLAQDYDGYPRPLVEIELPKGVRSIGILKWCLYQIAAELSLASIGKPWGVQVSVDSDSTGRVYLELNDGTDKQGEEGMLMLKQVIGSGGRLVDLGRKG